MVVFSNEKIMGQAASRAVKAAAEDKESPSKK